MLLDWGCEGADRVFLELSLCLLCSDPGRGEGGRTGFRKETANTLKASLIGQFPALRSLSLASFLLWGGCFTIYACRVWRDADITVSECSWVSTRKTAFIHP